MCHYIHLSFSLLIFSCSILMYLLFVQLFFSSSVVFWYDRKQSGIIWNKRRDERMILKLFTSQHFLYICYVSNIFTVVLSLIERKWNVIRLSKYRIQAKKTEDFFNQLFYASFIHFWCMIAIFVVRNKILSLILI